MPPAAAEPADFLAGEGGAACLRGRPSAYGRSSVVSPAAGGNLTAAGDGI